MPPAPRATRPRRRSPAAAVAIGATTLVLGACSSGSVSGVADGPPTDLGEITDLRGQPAVTITMSDNIYAPRAVQVSPGTKVTFRNDGANVHNATPDEDGPLAAVTVSPTESADVTVPSSPGTYRFYCSLHASRDSGLQRGAFVVG